MKPEKLIEIFNQFNHQSEFDTLEELKSGHINDTYFVKTKQAYDFVLQRINHHVFKDVEGLINNKVLVSNHIKKKLSHLSKEDLNKRVLRFESAKDGKSFYKDKQGNYWNLMYFIADSQTFETVKDEKIAYEGGKLFGEFLNLTNDFNASKLSIVIPKFHDMSHRFKQFESSIQSASKKRLDIAQEYINKIYDLKQEMHVLEQLKKSGKIKTRVTHNDTKISNALFSKENKGLCVIDTDTVMPGIIHYDFGDAIRTICNTTAEDETNLDLVAFNANYYNAYLKGFLEKVKSSMSVLELQYLPLAAKTMIFIMALRFLTDYLNGDIYYKTKYQAHNLDRAKNQFKLLDSLIVQENQLQPIK